MCCKKIKNNNSTIANRSHYKKICGPDINLHCCFDYNCHLELIFAQDIKNRDYIQYMDFYCFKSNNLFSRDSYDPLVNLNSSNI